MVLHGIQEASAYSPDVNVDSGSPMPPGKNRNIFNDKREKIVRYS